MGLIDLIYSSAWAIRPEALAAIIALVERDDIAASVIAEAMHFDPARVEAARYAHELRVPIYGVASRNAVAVDGAQLLTRRGATGVLSITGPIVRRASLFSSMSGGGASVEQLSRDFARAVEDPSFQTILLDVDSPGGEANGIAELADQIYQARDQKQIVAYVSDLGASAAYWLASAAGEIVAAETSALGSIGVVAAVRDPKASKSGQLEFVSSVSPNKRPDPTTQAGAAQYQNLVDTLGDIFVGAVARNRGVSTETVVRDFGAGGLKVGRDAVAAGLADRLGSFEGTLRELAEREPTPIETRRRVRPAASTEPASEPGAAEDGERALPTTAATERSPSPARRSPMQSLRDRIVALLSEPGDGSLGVDGSADQEASIVSQHLTDAPGVTSAPAEPTPLAQPAPDSLTARMAALEDENRALRAERIQERARAFVREQQSALKATAPQEAAIIALYAQLASDDEARGPITAADGTKINRVSLFASYFATVSSRRDLTAELLDPEVHRVLAERRSVRKRSAEEEPDDARVSELLGMTALGREQLKSQNGSAKHGAH